MKKSPFQFGLKGLFVAITATALLPAGLLATDPGIQLAAINGHSLVRLGGHHDRMCLCVFRDNHIDDYILPQFRMG